MKNLHEVKAHELDQKIRDLAQRLNGGKLLAKLSCGDVIAIEAKYHLHCLTTFYNLKRILDSDSVTKTSQESIIEGMTFAELIS